MPEYRVAGRWLLAGFENKYILKPLQRPPKGEREMKFYQTVFDERCTNPLLLALRPLIPRYHGILDHDGLQYLILEDIIRPFRKPSVCDVSMGTITYDPEATQEKKERVIAKTSSRELMGFSISGMRVYRPAQDTYVRYDKAYCRSLQKDKLLNGLDRFLGSGDQLRREVVPQFLQKLRGVEHWFTSQNQLSFYASELLMVYEGYKETELSNGRYQNSQVDVRMIDFPHVFPTHRQDDNYLYGLKRLINHFERVNTIWAEG